MPRLLKHPSFDSHQIMAGKMFVNLNLQIQSPDPVRYTAYGTAAYGELRAVVDGHGIRVQV